MYLFLVVEAVAPQHTNPSAKIPTVELPDAEPEKDAADADVPEETTHPE